MPENDVNYEDFTLHEIERRYGKVPQDCAQVVVLEFPAKGFRWGEGIWIYAHTDHEISGQAEIDVAGSKMTTGFHDLRRANWSADDVGDDSRCRDAVSATTGAPSAVPSTKPGPGGKPPPAPSGKVPPTPAPAPLPTAAEIGFTFDASFAGDPRPSVPIFGISLDHRVWADDDFDKPPIAAGATIRIKLWGMRSIDWGGVVVEVSRSELKPKDEIAWRKKLDDKRRVHREDRAKSDDAWKKRQAHLDDCRKRPKDADCQDVAPKPPSTPASTPATTPSTPPITNTPPPAPRVESPPPKPSDGAIWVSGRWVFDGRAWSYWSPGFWRVPDADVTGKHTTTAPKMPPAPKTENKPPLPIPGAVWTPGYWHWQVSVWVWIDGAWRMPPVAGASWKPSEWRVDASGVVRLEPGGWITP